jgi:peptidoglycan L-alanyl-D-glutamate endopeptidase CwlK
MSYKLGPKSLMNLKGVHPDLQRVVERAIGISESDFTVLEGLRSLERQKTLLAAGKSKTLHSRHITGHAVDIIPFPVSWDWKDYPPIEKAMKQAAKDLGVDLEWGGDWKSFPDAPHHQLSYKSYPNAN